MFFESWASLLRVLLTGVLCYCSLIVLLRLSGKRTLSKMNAFDFIVTVALGSTLATILLDNSIPIVNGVAALGLLIFFQYAITWASVRSETIRSLVKSEPTALVLNGRYLESAMRQQRVTRDEIEAALRDHGNASVSEIACVVLETDGSLTVVPKTENLPV
jgi:uncharacterized membrane protein YcaP (DUF421 family)